MQNEKDSFDWDEAFMNVVSVISERLENNGEKNSVCFVNEENKIIRLGYEGVSFSSENNNSDDLKGSRFYCLFFPNSEDAHFLIQKGIKEIIFKDEKYNNKEDRLFSKKLLELAGIKIRKFHQGCQDNNEKGAAAAKIRGDLEYIRPSWDQYFMNIAELVGSRGTCDRGRSGCIAVRDKRILATGYVGSPIGLAHCDEIGHEMHTVTQEDGTQSRHCIRTTHAEQNVVAQAARLGIALEGATVYCHMTPCYVCAKIFINAGIKRVVCKLDYHGGQRSKEIFKEAGIQYELLNEEIQKYKDM